MPLLKQNVKDVKRVLNRPLALDTLGRVRTSVPRPVLAWSWPVAATMLLAFALMSPVHALSTDSQQPINIEADSVDIDNQQGISVYKGNVVMTQGSIRLSGDVVTVYSPNQVLQKAVAEGNPAKYKQRPDNKEEDMRAQAQRMEYFADTEKLILLEGAHVWQGKDEFSGNKIEYDTKRSIVQASKAPSGKERVQVIIQPQKKAPAATAPKADPAQP